MRVAVLGAGYMGSAMATVAKMRGHDVRLWGTWLDDELLDACANGGAHPRLKLALDGISLFRSAQLAEALANAELVVHAVKLSTRAIGVMTKAAPHLPDVPVLSVSKGFLEVAERERSGSVDVVVPEQIGRAVRFVHAAGPAKAIEIARRVLRR